VLETFSVSHGKTYPYLPLIELLKAYFQITPPDDERSRQEKITGKVLTLDHSLEDTVPYLFALLGVSEPPPALAQMDAQIRKRRTFEAIKRLLLRESLNQPLILLFEDLHWLDSETQAFLDLLSESVATARILLLVNYRPEYQHAWGHKSYYTQQRLDPLGQEDAQELLVALVGGEEGLQGLKQLILTKAEGNPFFIEEIVQALFEQKVLVKDPSGGAKLASPLFTQTLTAIPFPSTVQGILAARIDRLGMEEKTLLQTLAVIGKEFSLGLLQQVVEQPEEELRGPLSYLQAAEFIYEQPAFPEVEYTFKHALTQEVAYNSLLIERRKVLHGRTAQAIELLFQNQLEDHYGDLAYHYGRSGNTWKAVEYLQLVGQQAAQRSAHTESVTSLTTALGLLQTLPDTPERTQREITLQIALAASLQATKGPSAPEVEHAYTRARALFQQGEETPQLFSVLRGLWVLHHVRAELPKARELGEQLLQMAERVQDPALMLEAHRALGSTFLWQGEFSLARAHLEQSLTLYDPHQHRFLALLHGGADPGVSCLCDMARALWFLGYPDQALQRSQAALTLAEELADPFSLGFALVFAAGLHQLRREGQAAQQRAEAGIALAREQEFAPLVSAGTIRRGWALAEQGRIEEGLAQMEQGLAARRTTRADLAQPYFLALQAEVYGKMEQSEQALPLLAEALAMVEMTGEHRLEAELYRLKGQLTLQQAEARGWRLETSPSSAQASSLQSPVSREVAREAEECFHKAIKIAQKQQAKSLELRAVVSLSRLWRQQGKKEEARQMLAEIYGWFTEGFGTVDLKEAKALLEELAHA
jgi:predicted ATPase